MQAPGKTKEFYSRRRREEREEGDRQILIFTTLIETSTDNRSWWGYGINEIPSLLLRLYEQAQESNSEVANRCLDIWDELFEKRVGMTRELTKSIEK